jgi:methylamine dehydrogenase accessory protein MauD
MMNLWWLVSYVGLWGLVLLLGFLLLGALRALGLQGWRLEQLEATAPTRVGRSGLKPGKSAPEFTLPNAAGGEIGLHEFAGRRLLLVFTQSGCGPCNRIMPELNRFQAAGKAQVLVVNNGEPKATRVWAEEVRARFPVAVQEHYSLSRRYEVFATPFAFLIDERGVITSKGIINHRQHIDYILDGAHAELNGHADRELSAPEASVSKEVRSSPVTYLKGAL